MLVVRPAWRLSAAVYPTRSVNNPLRGGRARPNGGRDVHSAKRTISHICTVLSAAAAAVVAASDRPVFVIICADLCRTVRRYWARKP